MFFVITNSDNHIKPTQNLLFLRRPIHVSTGHLASSAYLNVLCQSRHVLASTRRIHGVQFQLSACDTPYLTDRVEPGVEPRPVATTFIT